MILRSAKLEDAADIAAIFNDAIMTSMAVWKEQPVSSDDRASWMQARLDAGHPVIIAEENGQVLGYASYAQLSGNEGYRFCVEDSIYVHPDAKGKGVGRIMLTELIQLARDQGKHSMVSEMDAGNEGSKALHRKLGFTEVGRIPHAGFKLGEWRDLLILQLMLDEA